MTNLDKAEDLPIAHATKLESPPQKISKSADFITVNGEISTMDSWKPVLISDQKDQLQNKKTKTMPRVVRKLDSDGVNSTRATESPDNAAVALIETLAGRVKARYSGLLASRKALSMTDLLGRKESSKNVSGAAVPDIADIPIFIADTVSTITSPRPNHNGDKIIQASGQHTSEKAAIIIQRFYRFYCLRVHFAKLVSSVNEKPVQQLSSKQRRMSVMLWAINQELQKQPKTSIATVQKAEAIREQTDALVQSDSHGSLNEAQVTVSSDEAAPISPNTVLKEKHLRRGIHFFNTDGNKGMITLIKNQCLASDPLSIAQFLLSEDRLSKVKIGEYLGAGEELQNQVLREFIGQLDFTNSDFDHGLRTMLRTFRLPGEAQKIDRVMSEFARKYCHDNPTVFSSSDTAYVLAYSLVMLNTDAHNVNVKKKMTLQDFIRNNRGIDNKQNLPEEFLGKLYSNIVTNEIKMNEHDNVYRVNEVFAQIQGKVPAMVPIASRRFIREFTTQQVPEIGRSNTHRHERIVFLFNDLLVIAKPRTPQLTGTMASDAMISSQTVTNPTPHQSNKYHLKFCFNLNLMHLIDVPDNQYHSNVVDINNPNGRLITLSFLSADEKRSFSDQLSTFVEDINELEDEKLAKLKALTVPRSKTAKLMIESIYMSPSFEPLLLEGHTNLSRFSFLGDLRTARAVLLAESHLLQGTRSKRSRIPATAKPALHQSLVPVQHDLEKFGVHIMFESPSPSPEVISAADVIGTETENTYPVSTPESKSPIATTEPSSGGLLNVVGGSDTLKRRNTVSGFTGYDFDMMNSQIDSLQHPIRQ